VLSRSAFGNRPIFATVGGKRKERKEKGNKKIVIGRRVGNMTEIKTVYLIPELNQCINLPDIIRIMDTADKGRFGVK
jgi:hypothetical protein